MLHQQDPANILSIHLFPQKRKHREKDDSDAVSLCSFDFKVNKLQYKIWKFYSALLNSYTVFYL